MTDSGEATCKRYLQDKGLTVIKIPEGRMKTVDFKVYAGQKFAFYLEEKTLILTPPVFRRIDPVYNSLAKNIHEAEKQFRSVNPDRIAPNVLAFTNLDPAKNINHLFATLTGFIFTAGGGMRRLPKIRKNESDISLIDLYLWFDREQPGGYIFEEEAEPDYQERLRAILALSE